MKLKVSLRFVLSLLIFCGNGTASAQLRLDSIWDALNESAATPPPRPQLKARSNGNFGPAFYSKGKVYYDSLFLFSLHEQFGHKKATDAAAHLLAHELAHFTRRHSDTHLKRLAYGESTKENGLNADNDRIKALMAKENDADLYGGMNSTQAGFGSLKVAPDLLRFVYSYYKLPDNIEGYPSLDQRIRDVKKLAKQIKIIDEAHRLALATCLFGYPLAAKRILQSIIYDGNFRSAEVLHLTSFTLFKEATLMNPSPIIRQWTWPIKFDQGAHKTSLIRAGSLNDPNDLLNEAIQLEEKSLALRNEANSGLMMSLIWYKNHLNSNKKTNKPRNPNLIALDLILCGSNDEARSILAQLEPTPPQFQIPEFSLLSKNNESMKTQVKDFLELRISRKKYTLRINSGYITSYWKSSNMTLFEIPCTLQPHIEIGKKIHIFKKTQTPLSTFEHFLIRDNEIILFRGNTSICYYFL